ncbi:unnamed protein product [Gordionus sp. m RMFG-2023]
MLGKLENIQNRFGGGLYRSEVSRNSSAEMYFISGPKNNIRGTTQRVMEILNSRFKTPSRSMIPIQMKGPTLMEGEKGLICDENLEDDTLYKTRLELIKKEHKSTFFFDKEHPYRTFKYLGSFATQARTSGGHTINLVLQKMM